MNSLDNQSYKLLETIAKNIRTGHTVDIKGTSDVMMHMFKESYPHMSKRFFEYFLMRANCAYSKIRVSSIDPNMLPNRIRGAAEYFLMTNVAKNTHTLFVIGPLYNAMTLLPEYYMRHLFNVLQMPLK